MSAPGEGRRASGGDEASAAMLRGGLVPALVVGAASVTLSALQGARPALSAALGSVLAIAALTLGPLLLRRASTLSPPATTALALGGYTLAVTALGLAFLLLAPASWLAGTHLAGALVAVTLAWLAGLVRAVAQLRTPAFDVALPPPVAERERPGQGGSPGSSPQAPR